MRNPAWSFVRSRFALVTKGRLLALTATLGIRSFDADLDPVVNSLDEVLLFVPKYLSVVCMLAWPNNN